MLIIYFQYVIIISLYVKSYYEKINHVRMAINMVIGSENDVSQWNDNEVNLRQLQQNSCDRLLQ